HGGGGGAGGGGDASSTSFQPHPAALFDNFDRTPSRTGSGVGDAFRRGGAGSAGPASGSRKGSASSATGRTAGPKEASANAKGGASLCWCFPWGRRRSERVAPR